MTKKIHDLKQLDGTRIGFIVKGLVVGILVGFVVSLFRLTIETQGSLVGMPTSSSESNLYG